MSSRHHGKQSAGEFARFADRHVYELQDLVCLRRFGKRGFGQFLLQHFAHESDSSQMLAQAVVKALPDSPLLAPADLKNCLLQTLPLGDVNSSHDDEFGRAVAMRKKSIRP